MYARRIAADTAPRRGVVLILILAMLGLLAVIGVSFATFSGQAVSGAKNFSRKLDEPPDADLIEFGIQQLINDTTNPMSALYGHSLKRDMYGNDAATNGQLLRNPNGTLPTVTAANLDVPGSNANAALYRVTTNIPDSVGLDFVGWIMRAPHPIVGASLSTNPRILPQTFKVVAQQFVNGVYVLEVAASHIQPITSFTDANNNVIDVALAEPVSGMSFALDGRYRHAFNGAGMGALDAVTGSMTDGAGNRLPGNLRAAQFAKFRVNRGLLNGNPNPGVMSAFDVRNLPMDEDYDAPDLENWFLAAETADGQVVIPSFHRPGIVMVDPSDPILNDWRLQPGDPDLPGNLQHYATRAVSKILRPRAVDHPVAGQETFPDLVPDPKTGKIEYDVDNDGDGTTDSVWLDLGHPVMRNSEGRLFKPLYAFKVIGLNGKMPLNTVGNLNGRFRIDDPNTLDNELGWPTFDHASHLGYSPSEVNPKFALQNGPTIQADASGGTPVPVNLTDLEQDSRQFDDGGVPVNLTQLRNLLTGTRKPGARNGDIATVFTDGRPVPMPNNVAEFDPATGNLRDSTTTINGREVVPRQTDAVAGRWGEPDSIANFLTLPGEEYPFDFNETLARDLTFGNHARAGRSVQQVLANNGSVISQYRFDGLDDNFDTYDLAPFAQPELSDALDAVGARQLASERIRTFLTPIDPTGNGVVTRWDNIVTFGGLWGLGPDRYGRVSYLHYFRPPGVPPFINNEGSAGNPSFPLKENFLNITHGYEGLRNPGGNNAPVMGAMPYNKSEQGRAPDYLPTDPPEDLYDTDTNTYVGTFSPPTFLAPNDPRDRGINAQEVTIDPATGTVFKVGYPLGGLQFKDPDEMDLYLPRPEQVVDAPFGPADLEWLYRRQDVDAETLSSRLADLAPISFVHSPEALTRSRMFSTDSWDRINYTFAHDNPDGTTWDNNSRFPAIDLSAPLLANPSFDNPLLQPGNNVRLDDRLPLGGPEPNVAHGERRINLNFPFPHSYDPFEPVRQKWITETYQTLKNVLPLLSVDEPHELAELGQFVVNIVDFRDPDNAITIWENPDVWHNPARRIDDNGTERDLPPEIVFANSPAQDAAGRLLQHYGMEYNPVAINEVLGFRFNYADPGSGGSDRNVLGTRLVVELVNTLTESGVGGSNPSNIDIGNWAFTLVREDSESEFSDSREHYSPAFVRPDPITGQLPPISDGSAGGGLSLTPPEFNLVALGTGLELTKADALGGDAVIRGLEADAEDPDPEYELVGGYRLQGENPNEVFPDEIEEETIRFVDMFDGDDNDERNRQDVNLRKNYDEDDDNDGTAEPWDLLPDPEGPAWQRFDASNNPAPHEDGYYHWLYLMRPANPLADPQPDPTQPDFNPMVVVDSIRFPFGGVTQFRGKTDRVTGQPAGSPTVDHYDDSVVSPPDNPDFPREIYSVERRQPYRGGQLVPDLDDPSQETPSYAYGFTEQVRASDRGSGRVYYDTPERDNADRDMNLDEGTLPDYEGVPNNPQDNDWVETSPRIRHTLGSRISPGSARDDTWDHFVFNDRDFMSVAELLLVPGCPPGLFTKRFVETAPPLPSPDPGPEPGIVLNAVPPDEAPDFGDEEPGMSKEFDRKNVHTYPYLVDKFFYSAPAPPAVNPNTGNQLTQAELDALPNDGWHRALEFFEVPAPSLNAVGPVQDGLNYDWLRRDRRPGLLNLNLVLDEEVFFGLLDDPRMNLAVLAPWFAGDPTTDFDQDGYADPTESAIPRVVTAVDANGSPVFVPSAAPDAPKGSYPYSDLDLYPRGRGFTRFTDATGATDIAPTINSLQESGMKAAFADFLKLTHGGSGYLFGHGDGPVGAPFIRDLTAIDFSVDNPRLARDFPFRSLAHPDIRSTLLRPANLSWSPFTVPTATFDPIDPNYNPDLFFPNPITGQPNDPLAPGTRNPNFPTDARVPDRTDPEFNPPPVPPIPPRRLFQLPDTTLTDGSDSVDDKISNASLAGQDPTTDPNVPGDVPHVPVSSTPNGANVYPVVPTSDVNSAAPYPRLFRSLPESGFVDDLTYLGQDDTTNPDMFPPNVDEALVSDPEDTDMRRHPYYRTEMLQKLMNLTTVRTHQYAVWVTVGFFEVIEPGDRSNFIPDELGRELGASNGTNQRHRAFFIIDRSRATGFDPLNPGSINEVILYRRRIE